MFVLSTANNRKSEMISLDEKFFTFLLRTLSESPRASISLQQCIHSFMINFCIVTNHTEKG
jgi:hypothetical protein